MSFDLNRYMGTWYELMHYPSWFQRNDQYNTKAVYQLQCDNTVSIDNSTIVRGQEIHSYGIGQPMGNGQLRVDFPQTEVNMLEKTGEFKPPTIKNDDVNYVIDKIWMNEKGHYIYAVVTDLKKESLYILSRFKQPCLSHYTMIMNYVIDHYDRDRLVQTPHY